MKEQEQQRIEHLLKETMQTTDGQAGAELRRDLWPAMLTRLEAESARVPWFDWALLAAVSVWLVVSPRAIPLLLYYL
jgi:hypothetical protein